MSKNEYTGTCYCGSLKYRVAADFKTQCFCHCRSCQLASGAPYVAWGTVEKDSFEILCGNMNQVSTSPGVIRGFCSECGTSLTYHQQKYADSIDICLATLDDPALVRPAFHLWISDKLPWVNIDDGLPQYQEWRNS